MIWELGVGGGSYRLQLAIYVVVTVAITSVVVYAIARLIDRDVEG